MKKIAAIIILLSTFSSANAQYVIAGTLSTGYFDIVPDTNINYSSSPSFYEFYDIHFLGNSAPDLRFSAYNTSGATYIQVIPLNSQFYVLFNRADSVYNVNQGIWEVTPVAKPLLFADTINKSGSTWFNSTLFISNNSGFSGTYSNVADFVSTSDRYVGVQYKTATDSVFGWIRVNCSSVASCVVKDYSFDNVTGIKQYDNTSNCTVYPNPFNDRFSFVVGNNSHVKASEVKIYNAFGEEMQFNFSKDGDKISIELPSAVTGIYHLVMFDGTKNITKKIIKN